MLPVRQMQSGSHPNRIKLVRENRQPPMTQAHLAAACGIAPSSMNKLEHGLSQLSTDRIYQIASILGCHPGELFAPLPQLPPVAQRAAEIAMAMQSEPRNYWLRLGEHLPRREAEPLRLLAND